MLAIAPGCELDVERGPDWLLVRVANLDPAETEAPPLADRIWRLLQQHFTYRLVLELDQVALLTSRLIGQLVKLRRRIGEHGGVMRLCGLSEENCEVLRTCCLGDHFALCENRQAAIMGANAPGNRVSPISWPVVPRSHPADFQFVGNLVHAVNVTERLLCHLFLEIRVDHPPKRDAARTGLKSQIAPYKVGISF